MTAINLNIGDILENRETRRKGKRVKVIAIGGGTVTVENVRNADGAILNSVGKQYNIKESRILDDYRVIHSDHEDIPETFEDIPMTPEEEEEAASLASDNLRSSQSWEDASLVEHHNVDITAPWVPFVDTVANYNSSPQEEDEDEITPEQEADLHNALKTVGYYKLPDRAEIVADIQDAIDGIKKEEKDENFDLSLEETVELIFDYIRSID